jgi:hypothetical protein
LSIRSLKQIIFLAARKAAFFGFIGKLEFILITIYRQIEIHRAKQEISIKTDHY